MQRETLKEYILQETTISQEHLNSEFKLNLITPICRLWKSSKCDPFVNDPFWAFFWPGGQALTRYVAMHDGNLEEFELVFLLHPPKFY